MTIDIAYGILDDVDIQQLEEHLNDDTACQIPQCGTSPGTTMALAKRWRSSSAQSATPRFVLSFAASGLVL